MISRSMVSFSACNNSHTSPAVVTRGEAPKPSTVSRSKPSIIATSFSLIRKTSRRDLSKAHSLLDDLESRRFLCRPLKVYCDLSHDECERLRTSRRQTE